MIKGFWCPQCKKKGLYLYDKHSTRPEKTDDITYMWCIYCEYKILSDIKWKK